MENKAEEEEKDDDDNNDVTIVPGLLHVEDKVREVNGVEVYTPEDMIRLLKEASTSVTMKIVPSHRNLAFREQVGSFTWQAKASFVHVWFEFYNRQCHLLAWGHRKGTL